MPLTLHPGSARFTATACPATNTAGDLVVVISVPIELLAMRNSGGGIAVTNTGAVTTTGLVSAPNGNVAITANSPLTVGTPGIDAGGDIVLTASNLTSAGNMTLNGPLTAGKMVNLDAGNNLVQNSAVLGASGVSARAGGSIRFGPFATANKSPISYSSGGVAVAPPPTDLASGGGPASQINTFVTFLDLFEKALDAQRAVTGSDFNADGSKKKRESGEIVTEGDVCR